MSNVQNYILGQRVENTVNKTEYDLNVWMWFFRKVSENREIEDWRPASYLDLPFHDGHKKERWWWVRANNSCFTRFLPSFSGKNDKMLFTDLGRSVLVFSTARDRSEFIHIYWLENLPLRMASSERWVANDNVTMSPSQLCKSFVSTCTEPILVNPSALV